MDTHECPWCKQSHSEVIAGGGLFPHRGTWRHSVWCAETNSDDQDAACTCGLNDVRRLALDAARTASVAGPDRERLATLADRIDTFCSACEGDRYLVTADPEDDGQPGDPYQVQCLDSIHACADMVRAAPSIEQEPGETDRNRERAWQIAHGLAIDVLTSSDIDGLREHATEVERLYAIREQGPGEAP